MSIDRRTRLWRDVRAIAREEIFDAILPEAIERNGPLTARGVRYKELAPLAVEVEGRAVTLRERERRLELEEGADGAGTVAVLSPDALSDLVQDVKSTMGLAMNAKIEVTRGGLEAWIAWEPVFRALFDGRPVHEDGAVVLRDAAGDPLDLTRSFTLDDDRDAMSAFLHEAGFLHIAGVFTEEEMAAVGADLDDALERARPDDGASWWAGDSGGTDHPVRVLWFQEQSAALRELLQDDRFSWIAELTGDDHGAPLGAEGLIKPLDIVSGLSDLPWHKDCGQGGHSYACNGMTVGISVTGADCKSGALGVVPGSHRANVQTARLDPSLDLAPHMLETKTGDLTLHCSDTLHMSHRPKERTRKVVYTGFRLRPKPGDVAPEMERAARARLTDVRDRIEASDQSS